jgi:hypothetical protein
VAGRKLNDEIAMEDGRRVRRKNQAAVGIFAGLKSAPENYNRNFILQQLRQYEAYGVTAVTALGLNGPLFYELRENLHAGRVPGADLFGADQGFGAIGVGRRRSR